MPLGTSLNPLCPLIEFNGISVTPASGVPQDFTNPVIYTVTSNVGDHANYLVTAMIDVSDGIDFSDIYQPAGADLTNGLGRFVYFGKYNSEADMPRSWYVIGEEDGVFILLQQDVYENEQRSYVANNTPSDQRRAIWSDSGIYQYLNNVGAQAYPYTGFFANGELASVQNTNINTIAHDIDTNTYSQSKENSSKDTRFYLASLHFNNINSSWNVTWSASLDNLQNKLLPSTMRQMSGTKEYWLRSISYDSTSTDYLRQGFLAGGYNDIEITYLNNDYYVRPLFKLNPYEIVFISEIGGNSLGSIAPNSGYTSGTGDDKNFKLTVIGENGGADVGTLNGIPGGVVYASDASLFLNGFTATPSGEGSFSVNYKVVQDNEGVRSIVGYGSSANLTSLSIDTSELTAEGEYTVYVWLQKNNAVQSHEATIPQYFKLVLKNKSIIYGDFTGNGLVDGTDVLWIQRYIVSNRDINTMYENFPTTIDTFCEQAADFTNNGLIDGTDAYWIQRYMVSEGDVDTMLENFPTRINFNHLRS
jgi:hypothetical protein